MNIEPNELYLAAAAAALLLLGTVVLIGGWRHARTARRCAAIESQFEALKADLAASTGIGIRAGERLRRLDQLSSQINERLGQLELRGEGRPYDQAIALSQRGADAGRLMSHYGLTRGEADLVSLVHGRRRG
jgi:uncharacterized protein DUF2802